MKNKQCSSQVFQKKLRQTPYQWSFLITLNLNQSFSWIHLLTCLEVETIWKEVTLSTYFSIFLENVIFLKCQIQNAGAIFQNNQSRTLKRCFNGRKSLKTSKRCARLLKDYVYQQLDNNTKVIKNFGIHTMTKPASFIKSVNKQRKLVLRSTKTKLRRHLNSISSNRAVSLSICSKKIKDPKIRKGKILLSTGDQEFNKKNCGQHQVTAIAISVFEENLKFSFKIVGVEVAQNTSEFYQKGIVKAIGSFGLTRISWQSLSTE